MIWTLSFDRRAAMAAIDKLLREVPDGWRVELRAPKRSDAQNRRLWAMLGDISRQCRLNAGEYTPEQWKCVFLRAMHREMQFLPDLNGGFFPAGFRSSTLTVAEMTALQDFMQAYGDEQGVAWTDPSQRQDDGR